MSAPRWACRLLARLAEPGRADEVIGDLEQAHARRLRRHARPVATLLTTLDTLDMALALLRARRRRASRAADSGAPASPGARTCPLPLRPSGYAAEGRIPLRSAREQPPSLVP
jgi:hypothetical protein